MSNLRIAVIGVGASIFGQHHRGIEAINGDIVGVMDTNPDAGQQQAHDLDCRFFPNVQTLLAETTPDVAVVITPHPSHAELSIASLEAGCHVLVEKPIAVEIGEADAMVEAARRAGRILAVNFQQRLRPEIIAARKLIQDGRLGRIQNADMKMTWTRTAIYYRMATWRGTWNGEGGGVLLNQAPHELDLLCYLLGLPLRVFAWTRTIHHQIETEDTVQAMLEWPNGVMGSVHISTAEAGQPQRFEIIGTGGRLALGNRMLEFNRFEMDLCDFIATNQGPFASPELFDEPVEIGQGVGDHIAIYHDLQRAIQAGGAPVADGASASMSLELANAMTYSSRTGQPVDLPLDRQKYHDLLAALRAGQRV